MSRAATWRVVLATQILGSLFALANWLEHGSEATPPLLIYLLCRYALAAILIMLAALTGDEAVRRRSSIVRSFLVVTLCASALNALAQRLLDAGFDVAAGRGAAAIAYNFFDVGINWSMIVLVYLNRRSTGRLLARLRADELARAESEQRVIASSLAGAEARMDSASVLRQLSLIRDLYANGHDGAEDRLEDLIGILRYNVARSVMAEGAATGSRSVYS
ncbi:MAG: hypothetical protein ACREVO_19190 [Steroidobacteraceae bacterium]